MFMDSVDELRLWMANYSKQLKMVRMPGALPESARKEFDKFMVCYHCVTCCNFTGSCFSLSIHPTVIIMHCGF